MDDPPRLVDKSPNQELFSSSSAPKKYGVSYGVSFCPSAVFRCWRMVCPSLGFWWNPLLRSGPLSAASSPIRGWLSGSDLAALGRGGFRFTLVFVGLFLCSFFSSSFFPPFPFVCLFVFVMYRPIGSSSFALHLALFSSSPSIASRFICLQAGSPCSFVGLVWAPNKKNVSFLQARNPRVGLCIAFRIRQT